MKIYGVLIPEQKIVDSIWKLRKNTVDKRGLTLPHMTIGYFGDIENEMISEIIKALKQITLFNSVELPVLNYIFFDNKIAAEFDKRLTKNIVENFEKVVKNIGVEINSDDKYIGDHMKVVRNIDPKDTEKMLTLIKEILPNTIHFERMALISENCEEKDILWESSLN